MKNKLKQLLPKKAREFLRGIVNRPITNFYKKNYIKKALLSYITGPFKKGVKESHTNYFEAITWGKILDELGYQVDVIDFNYFSKKIKIERYDVICGFGEVFENYIYTLNAKAKTIFYATGIHNCWQNHVTLKRLKDVYKKKGIWLGESSRYISKFYSSHVSYADAVIALGNHICAESYKPYNKNVYQLDAPFFRTFDYKDIIKSKKEDFNKHFLWFGSSGAIHKGLDLLLDYFVKRDDIYLHICGNVKNEKEFCRIYSKELFNTKNIVYHGFISVDNHKFKEILQQCGFIVFPSASEGGSPGVLTCIGNGGLIPVITRETTIDTGYEVWVEGLNERYIDKAINKCLSYNKNNLIELMYKNGEIVCYRNNVKQYEQNLRNILKRILL